MLVRQADAMKELMKGQPTGRPGRPEELAAAVPRLCGPAAGFVIGHGLAADDGYTVR